MKTYTITAQQALDSTKRKQYVNENVLAAFPPATGLTLEFFTIGKDCTNEEVIGEYESRDLVPASPFDVCAFDVENPERMDEMEYVATLWEDKNTWCYAVFDRWLGERRVHVHRHDGGWLDGCRFAGVRKDSTLSSGAQSLPSVTLPLVLEINGHTYKRV